MKNEDLDALLDDLGRVGREREAPVDPRWEALAAGTLSAEEAEALRQEAEGSEEGKRKYELFRPFDETETERGFAKLNAELAKEKAASAPAPAPAPVEETKTKGTVTPLRPASRRWAAAAGALALAAAFAFVMLLPPIVSYELAASAEQRERSAPGVSDAPLRLSDPESKLTLSLTPLKGGDASFIVKALLMQEGQIRSFNLPSSVAQPGLAITVSGSKAKLFPDVPAGTWTLVLAVGRPDAIPEPAELSTQVTTTKGHENKRGFDLFWMPIILDGGPTGALDVEFAGCEAVRQGPSGVLCEIPSRHSLTVWVNHPSPTLRLDGELLDTPGTAVQGGQRFSVPVSEGARALLVEAGVGASYSLALSPPETDAGLTAADDARKAGRADEARDRLRPFLQDPQPAIRAQATRILARTEFRAGEYKGAIQHYRDALLLDQEAGLLSAEVDNRQALSFMLSFHNPGGQPDFDGARRVLEEGSARMNRYPEGRAVQPYYLGLAERETADLRAALRSFEEAYRGAERLGLAAEQSDARRQIAGVLSNLGQSARALGIFRELEKAAVFGSEKCAEAQVLNDFGVVRHLDRRVRGEREARCPQPHAPAPARSRPLQ